MASTMEFGLLLPHFGATVSKSHLVDVARTAEAYGFDSLWARDHLIYRPNAFEEENRQYIDAFVTLSAVAAVVDDVTLGTAVGIPHRHPLHLAQLYANLDFMADGDVIAGFGFGGLEHEFEIAEIPFESRPQRHRETVEIMRHMWTGDETDYDGDLFSFEDAEQFPRPDGEIPIWMGGASPTEADIAWEYCDGWLPGRINLPSLEAGIDSLRRRADEAGEPMPTVGKVEVTSVDEDPEVAMEAIDVEGLLEAVKDYWIPPESGEFDSAEDLEGVFMAGTPEDVVEDVERFREVGVDHLVFDLRQRFDEIDYCLELLGERVLPAVAD